MNRVLVGVAVVGSIVLGGWLAYATTPRSVRSLIPDMMPLNDWHASVIGSLVVNRQLSP
ncbi:MAG: hypothetical protein F6K00_24245 [Leptolyngbya sp. SIOISBB]|nr:hypothetical protein [Leptolyngbya sp. SIOISBB]